MTTRAIRARSATRVCRCRDCRPAWRPAGSDAELLPEQQSQAAAGHQASPQPVGDQPAGRPGFRRYDQGQAARLAMPTRPSRATASRSRERLSAGCFSLLCRNSHIADMSYPPVAPGHWPPGVWSGFDRTGRNPCGQAGISSAKSGIGWRLHGLSRVVRPQKRAATPAGGLLPSDRRCRICDARCLGTATCARTHADQQGTRARQYAQAFPPVASRKFLPGQRQSASNWRACRCRPACCPLALRKKQESV